MTTKRGRGLVQLDLAVFRHKIQLGGVGLDRCATMLQHRIGKDEGINHLDRSGPLGQDQPS